mmetsp:Transcript_13043/g.19670  ORF Transcript_13043/g.19670 Transcript_13043/m.19670 type:complete len:614 (-) Transcript_13043:290-2131(-)
MVDTVLSAFATSLLQDLRAQQDSHHSTEDCDISDDVLVFKHIVDCVSVMHELYLSRISSTEEKYSPHSQTQRKKKKSLHAGLVASIGKVLQEAIIADSSLFGDDKSSVGNRVATSKHILLRFPAFSLQRLTSKNTPFIHYAAYNSQSLELVRIIHDLNGDAVFQEDADGALPLHWATLNTTTPDIALFLLQAYPKAVEHADRSGYLPLHWVVNQSSPVLRVVESLLESYTGAATAPSISGALPLHWAVNRSSPDVDVVKTLLAAHPQGVKHACKDQWLPLHYASNRANPSLSVMQLLIDAYPDSVSIRNTDGQVPLHRLLDRHNPSRRAVKTLIQACPATLRAADVEGYLPLHISLDGTQPPSVKLVQMLVQSCFQSVKHKTLDGLLPIHLAMKMEDADEEEKSRQYSPKEDSKSSRVLAIIKELVSLYPESAHEVAVDVIPLQTGANPDTWDGPWRKHRWTPMSLALSHGKNSDLAKLLRPYAKKRNVIGKVNSVLAFQQHHDGQAQQPQQTLPRQTPLVYQSNLEYTHDTSISINICQHKQHDCQRASTSVSASRSAQLETGGSVGRFPLDCSEFLIEKKSLGNKNVTPIKPPHIQTKTFLLEEEDAMELV